MEILLDVARLSTSPFSCASPAGRPFVPWFMAASGLPISPEADAQKHGAKLTIIAPGLTPSGRNAAFFSARGVSWRCRSIQHMLSYIAASWRPGSHVL